MTPLKSLDGAVGPAAAAEGRGFGLRQSWLHELERAQRELLGKPSAPGLPQQPLKPEATPSLVGPDAIERPKAGPEIEMLALSARPVTVARPVAHDPAFGPAGDSVNATPAAARDAGPGQSGATAEAARPRPEDAATPRDPAAKAISHDPPNRIVDRAHAQAAPAGREPMGTAGDARVTAKSTAAIPMAPAASMTPSAEPKARIPSAVFPAICTSTPPGLATIESQRLATNVRAPAASAIPPANGSSPAIAAQSLAADASLEDTAPAAADEPPRAQADPAEPIPRRSMHVFSDAGEFSVWVRDAALDAPTAQGLTARIAAELAAAGKRLAAFTVNGRLIFTRKKGR